MVENFTREFDKLSGESIMGIYGAAHTGLEAMDYTKIDDSVIRRYYRSDGHVGNDMPATEEFTVE